MNKKHYFITQNKPNYSLLTNKNEDFIEEDIFNKQALNKILVLNKNCSNCPPE